MFRKFFTFLIVLLSVIGCNAASIHGKVTDASTGEELLGSTLYIKELKVKTISGIDGTYIIKNIPKGKYTITCSYVGYQTIEQNIIISSDDISTFDFKIIQQTTKLNQVTINGHNDKSTDLSARSSERNSNQLINVVSAKTIELSPDLTVANVIQRVSGVTLERSVTGDGQYAILRGMDKRFSYTMVNNVKIPGTNNKYRYVPLDIFPSFLVDRIEVTKSLTPNLEGDAIGGAVNMIMKDAPDNLQLNMNIAGGYSQLFIDREFESFDSKVVKSKSPYEIFGENYTATPKDFTTKNLDLKKFSPLPNLIGDFSIGTRLFNKKLGVMLAGSFNRSYKGSNSTNYGVSMDSLDLPVIQGGITSRKISELSSQIGLHNKFDFQLNSRHKFVLYNTYMNTTTTQVRESESFSDGTTINSVSSYSMRYKLNNQQLLSTLLQGNHLLSKKLKADWSATYGLAENTTPDYTNLSMFYEVQNKVKLPLTLSNSGSTRRWSHNSDNSFSGALNLTYTPNIAKIPLELTFGGLYHNTQRSSFYNEYLLFPVLNTDYKSMQGRDWNNFSEIPWKNGVDLNNADALNFEAYETIYEGFGQFKFHIHKVQIIGGLRIENTDQSYYLKYAKGDGVPPVGDQIYTDFLPGLHFKYTPYETTNVRASYYRSINRPGFLEIVPYINVGEEYTEMGNPNIKHTVADNFDLRYEYFPKPLDQFMVGLFYKNIKDPIEYGWSDPQGSKGNVYYMPNNYGTAKNLGVEVDFIKYFRFLGIKANYTYTHSQITTSKSFMVHKANGWETDYALQTRPLFGQSAHVGNLSLLFKDTRSGWDAQLSGTYTGDRIYLVSRSLNDDEWQKGFIQMDASIQKKFKNRLTLYLKAKNLLNTPMELYLKKTNPINEAIDQNKSDNKTITRRDYYGQTYLIGVRYLFK